MKLTKSLFFSITLPILFLFSFQNCSKQNENKWNIEIEPPQSKVKIIDISKKYYDTSIDIETFKKEFGWFQGTYSDEDFIKNRTDSLEIAIYKEGIKNIDITQLENQFTDLFAHVKHYYPKFKKPKIYLFSSALQMVKTSPITYIPEKNYLFVDVSSFLGEKSKFYDGLEEYFKPSMNPENIIVKATEIIVSNITPFDRNNQKFIDLMIYQGKRKVLMDAFLPEIDQRLKMGYSQKQYEWTVANEANIWNFFVENDLVFSPDPRLVDRFITEGPFSKFYTEVDQKSSPKVAIYIGWQICNSFIQEHDEISLHELLKMNATKLFNQSKYNPKN